MGKMFRPVLQVFVISVVFFSLHKLAFNLFGFGEQAARFYHSLEFLYVFFFGCAAVIVLILAKIREKSIDNVGYTFLLLTCIKMAVAYAVLYPILNNPSHDNGFEKGNFFMLFALFLTMETTITIRMLNKG